jgi:anti-sigma B factor antagonist
MSLEINQRSSQGVSLVDLAGKITLGQGSIQLRDTVAHLLAEGNTRIVLNLAGVQYVDSSGIGELVSRHMTTRHAGGRLVLLHLPPKIRDLLQITKLLSLFEVYEEEAAALASFLG